jgi:arsenate reductase-like glutaredoxin family protein
MNQILVFTLLLIMMQVPVTAQNRWEPVFGLVAGTPRSRLEVLQKYNLTRGEYLIGLMAINCGTCDKVAKELNQKVNKETSMAIFAIATPTEIKAWKHKLGIDKLRIIPVKEQEFTRLGAIILPTLIKVREGKYISAMEVNPGFDLN